MITTLRTLKTTYSVMKIRIDILMKKRKKKTDFQSEQSLRLKMGRSTKLPILMKLP